MKQDINLLEGVQKRAVRSVQGLHGSYEEKLQQINLPSLVDRRLRGDMIQTYKIVNRIDEVEPGTWFEIAGDTQRPTRSTTNIEDGIETGRLTLKSRTSCLNVRKHFFSKSSHGIVCLMKQNVQNLLWTLRSNTISLLKDVIRYKNLFTL